MTEFTKTKMHFALALLGTLFALHPVLEKMDNEGVRSLDVRLRIPATLQPAGPEAQEFREVVIKAFYAYVIVGGLLSFSVYCYALALLSEKPSSWVERVGNYSYALALMLLPLYAALWVSNRVEDRLPRAG